MILTRRAFLVTAAGLAAHAATRRADTRRADPLRIGLVGFDDASDAALGARLGVDEGARVATMFGLTVALTAASQAHVLIGGSDDAAAERSSRDAERSGALFLNIAAPADELRGAHCRAHTFHIAPSASVRRALGDVRLWHESLTQYGAAQLNDRFRVRFGRAMTDDAWAAWVAVKIAVEAALRTHDVSSAASIAYLTRPGVRFDGHKGRPLSFDAAHHQLQQPLYHVHPDASGATIAEEVRIPEAAPASGAVCGAVPP